MLIASIPQRKGLKQNSPKPIGQVEIGQVETSDMQAKFSFLKWSSALFLCTRNDGVCSYTPDFISFFLSCG